jgi:hypothetical protein
MLPTRVRSSIKWALISAARPPAGSVLQGERNYDCAWITITPPAGGYHSLLVRRRISEDELAFYRCGPVAIVAAAEILSLDVSRVTLAVDYYSDYQEEIDAEIAAADEASERAEHAWRVQRQLIA